MQDKIKKIGQVALATLVAVFLFVYATTTNYKNARITSAAGTATETYSYSVTDVTVSVKYNKQKYFVTGIAPSITVELIGSNKVALQKEVDEATRSFEVTADLRDLDPGTHSVQLQISSLPSGINATIVPTSFNVKIGNRTSKTFPIEGKITQSQLASGYVVSKIVLGDNSVKVTSDEDTIHSIDHVEAVVPDASKLADSYTGTATLQAVDAEGNILPVVFSPETTSIEATFIKK
ncbi:hypothetical protein K6V78_07705 [Streptococcus gallolyticus]|uniref:CdaR family protein n=1 Tax=Streptococcus hepaticus TaxID=3349163 RepID=UPI001C96779A|nr:hypothetical protein [Streptococcus gallolyticus]MBY5041195.1 hypothetical protein [Streptococcus gallolyticus]